MAERTCGYGDCGKKHHAIGLCLNHYRRHQRGTLPDLGDADDGSKDVDLEIKKETLRKLRLENDAKEGTLVESKQVEKVWSSKLESLKTALDAAPARIKNALPDLDGKELASIRKELELVRLSI